MRASSRPSSPSCSGRYGYKSLRYVGREELRTLVASERYLGALYDSNSRASASAQLHARPRGGGRKSRRTNLRRQPRALLREAAGGRVRIATAQGEVRARQLVLCGNVYLGALPPPLARKIMAVATYIVATEPLGARARELIATTPPSAT